MFEINYRINFFDADPAGILFFANIFKIAHSAYEKFYDSLKLKHNYFNDNNIVLPIIHSQADFKMPFLPGDYVNIYVVVSKLKKSSFELTFNFFNKEKKIAAVVKTVHVAVTKKDFQKTELPFDLSVKLKEALKFGTRPPYSDPLRKGRD